jgi:hypothetical protein
MSGIMGIYHPERLLGTFLVYEGKKVIVVPAPNATIELIRIYLVGTVMAMVLHQRGCLILHGSGVVIDGKAVAFVGRSGWGKSSIAAALAQMGYPLVSDDIFALDLSSNQPVVYPGFSQYKVSEETAQVLGHQTSSLLNRDVQNRGYINCPNFTTKTLAVDRIYLLAKDAENGIESIKPIEVMTQLLRHSVPTIWSLPQPPEHFFQCSKLINTTPIYRLKRANDIASLPQLAKLVEQHARENSQNAIAI